MNQWYKEVRFSFCIQVLEEFYNIFGPELKAVTGDPKRIEEVLVRVDALVTPLEEVCKNYLELTFFQMVQFMTELLSKISSIVFMFIEYCTKISESIFDENGIPMDSNKFSGVRYFISYFISWVSC